MSIDTSVEHISTTFGAKELARMIAPKELWNFLRESRLKIEGIGGFPRTIEVSLNNISASFLVDGPVEQRRVKTVGNEGKFLQEILLVTNPYSIIVDVGAHIGTHAVLLAKAALQGTVVAVEPDPKCVAKLHQNSALNNLSNMKIVHCAITDNTGDQVLMTSRNGLEGPASALQMHSSGNHETPVKIAGCTLDYLLQKFSTIDILVLDAEGHENSIFHGMSEIKPTHIFVEVHPKLGGSLEETLKLLGSKGYLCVRKYLRGGEILTHFVYTG